jgi:hypothetical protein
MLQTFAPHLITIVLLLAALFGPEHVAIGLRLLGPDVLLELMGRAATMAVIIYNVIFTVITMMYMMWLYLFYVHPKDLLHVEATSANKIVANPLMHGTFSVVLYAFMFASGFYYTGVIGILMNILGLHIIKIINQHITLTADEDNTRGV